MPKIEFVKLEPWQYVALNGPYTHFCMYGGVGTGKSFTGSHFSICNMLQRPDVTGLIGANTYDQLSQASLREMLYWLDHYGLPYVVDSMPPADWGQVKKRFKTYRNTLSVKVGNHIAHAFTRIMSDPDALRGIEISWYWLDEIRDTEQAAHDEVLKRQRESDFIKGLVTTTTNGEDWSHQRYNLAPRDQKLFGCLHVPTSKAVEAGILTQDYYRTLQASLTPLMAEQELDAKHVNVMSGRAYYAMSGDNRMRRAPWGDDYPNPDRPLIVGCDFNFQPSPCVWVVGQLSPDGDRIHWFREIASVETSTPEMAMMLLAQFPGFFYRIYGDASGNRGTTSNAGVTDYNQIANVLSDGGAIFTIDVEQANPLVKNRVENVNACLRNALGEIRMTYDPQGCPLLDSDLKMVGWKTNVQRGQGKLDNGGDLQRTHASDGVGYALWKLFPPGQRARIIDSMPSSIRSEMYNAF